MVLLAATLPALAVPNRIRLNETGRRGFRSRRRAQKVLETRGVELPEEAVAVRPREDFQSGRCRLFERVILIRSAQFDEEGEVRREVVVAASGPVGDSKVGVLGRLRTRGGDPRPLSARSTRAAKSLRREASGRNPAC